VSGQAVRIQDPGAAALQARLQAAPGLRDKVLAACGHEAVMGPNDWPAAWVDALTQHWGVIRDRGLAALLYQVSR
jgi:hypothetical protein